VINNHEHSQDDLRLLDDFVKSLQRASHISEGIDRFRHLCEIFYKIAESYTSAKSREAVMSEFDDYLSTLGFVPTFNNDGHVDAGPGAASGFQDWYAGNVSLYGLVQEDLSNITGLDGGVSEDFTSH